MEKVLTNQPWLSEPDELSWDYNYYKCRIRRHPDLLHYCGYVGITPDHPFYGQTYRQLTNKITVHGGLTYAGRKRQLDPDRSLWWLGFDCMHAGDLLPTFQGWPGTYRDLHYVICQVVHLVDQLIFYRKQINPKNS